MIVSCISELTYWPRNTSVNGESDGGNERGCVITLKATASGTAWFYSTRLSYCSPSSRQKQRHFGIRRIMTDVTRPLSWFVPKPILRPERCCEPSGPKGPLKYPSQPVESKHQKFLHRDGPEGKGFGPAGYRFIPSVNIKNCVQLVTAIHLINPFQQVGITIADLKKARGKLPRALRHLPVLRKLFRIEQLLRLLRQPVLPLSFESSVTVI